MKFKRIFKEDDEGAPIRDDDGNLVLDYVKVLRYGKKQHFTQKFFDKAMQEGWITLSRGMVILHTKPDELQYKIIRSPGYFCCFDNAPLGGEKEARAYVATNFDDQVSPDRCKPAGYRKDNFFACELVGE